MFASALLLRPASSEEVLLAYLVLARKWRPRGFDAITGQEHVTRTLKNAILQNRVHHAFLFCGARGVGKTSAARVLARALNCQKSDGPTIDPCGECSACVEIAAGTAVDVFEIDGASNRGIGEIRELRDGIAYAPQRDRYKVYIIDEVHMLTTEAFNALLKTLEEPPAHVKFIFATTEPHKIPVTILSRCQRFDFKRIPLGIMSQRLSEILLAEGVTMDPAALRLVARESEGSMRDALSLLDRVISFSGTSASYEAVASVLGVADRAWLQRLIAAALEKNIPAALKVVQEAFDYGLDLKKFASDLVQHLRDAAVLQVAGSDAPEDLTDLSAEEKVSLLDLGKRIQTEDLQRMLRLWTETAERLVQASFPRLEVEMAVIRMCRLKPLQPLDVLVQRLEALERRLEAGTPLPPLRESNGPKADPQAERLGIHAPRVPVMMSAPIAAPVVEPPAAPIAAPVVEPPAAVPIVAAELARPSPEPEPAPTPEPAAAPDPKAKRSRAKPKAAEAAPTPASTPTPTPASTPTPTPASTPTPTPASTPAPAPTPDHPPLDSETWELIVDQIRPGDPQLAGLLAHAKVASHHDGTLTLEVAGAVSEQRLQAKLPAALALVAAQRPDVRDIVIGKVQDASDTPHQRKYQREQKVREGKRKDVERHPLVVELLERFGGTLGVIEVDDGDKQN